MGAIAENLKEAEEYALSLLQEDPNMTIDELARMVHGRCKRPLTKGALVRLRRQVRGEPERPPVKPFNPVLVVTPPSTTRELMEHESTPQERREYLERWCLEHPDCTIDGARQAVTAKFGMGVGTAAIAETVRTVKALYKEQQLEAARPAEKLEEPLPTREPLGPLDVAAIARLMREAGVRSITLNGDRYHAVTEGSL